MLISCNKTSINDECKLGVNSFFQIVLNSTNDYSSYANKVYLMINLNVNKYPNNNMRKENSLIDIIKYIDKIYQNSLPKTRASSDTIWNTGCRFFARLFGLNEDLCD